MPVTKRLPASPPNAGEHIREPTCAPCIGGYDRWETLSEDMSRALRIGTEEAADMQFQADRTAHPGQIGNLTHIARVNACRRPMTKRTLGLGRGRCYDSSDSGRGSVEQTQMQTGGIGEQGRLVHDRWYPSNRSSYEDEDSIPRHDGNDKPCRQMGHFSPRTLVLHQLYGRPPRGLDEVCYTPR